MDKEKLQLLKNLFETANRDFISPKEFEAAMVIIIAAVDIVRKQLDEKLNKNDAATIKKIDDFIALCERQMQQVTKNAEGNLTEFRKELNSAVEEINNSIKEIELTPGEPGEDAELTDEDKQEMTDALIVYFKKEYQPQFQKKIEKAIAEAVKNIKPNTTIIRESGGVGAPFELPIKAGLNVTVSKDASGAYVIAAQAGFSDTFVDNEVVAGVGTSFTLAHVPIAGSQHIYANGQRLTPTVDYTILGAVITTGLSWDAGTVLADYRY